MTDSRVSMSTVWDRASAFLSDRLVPVAGISALAIFVPSALSTLLEPLGQGAALAPRLMLLLVSLVLTIVTLWGQLAITALALDPAAPVAAARARASRRLGAMVLVALAMLVVGFLLSLPVVGALVANGVDLSRLGQPGGQQTLSLAGGGFIALYLLVLIPVLLWLVVRFATLVAPIVVGENQALGALGRSFRLTRGLTWKLIGVILLFLIVAGVAYMAAVSVFGGLFALLLGGTGPFGAATVATALIEALTTTIFGVIATVFLAKLYRAVRERETAREGVGPA